MPYYLCLAFFIIGLPLGSQAAVKIDRRPYLGHLEWMDICNLIKSQNFKGELQARPGVEPYDIFEKQNLSEGEASELVNVLTNPELKNKDAI